MQEFFEKAKKDHPTVQEFLKKAKKDHLTVQEFLETALKAYVECATYMAEKILLENEFLKYVAAIDPNVITSRSLLVLKSLLKLPLLMKNVLVGEEVDKYESNYGRIMIDFELPDNGGPL